MTYGNNKQNIVTMKKTIITLMAAMAIATAGCDKIDINNTHKPYTPTGGSKTVLIKDFTGARCVNCPEAADYAHELQHRLGEDRIFILSVHAGYLATPAGQFPDFLTDEGTAWYNNHDSNPLFSVDHVALTDGNTLNVEQIDTPVSDALSESQTFDIAIANDYDETLRQLKVTSEVTATSEYSGNLSLTVCLVEDSLVGWQIIPGGMDREYVFRNVFRGTLNGADGEPLPSNHVFVEDTFAFTHSMTLDSTYNADQCYILSYVSDNSKNGKILQTAMQKVK